MTDLNQQEIDAMSESFRSQGLTWSQTNFAVAVVRNTLSTKADRDTALLRQALYALEIYGAQSPDVHQTITTMRERLGEKT